MGTLARAKDFSRTARENLNWHNRRYLQQMDNTLSLMRLWVSFFVFNLVSSFYGQQNVVFVGGYVWWPRA